MKALITALILVVSPPPDRLPTLEPECPSTKPYITAATVIIVDGHRVAYDAIPNPADLEITEVHMETTHRGRWIRRIVFRCIKKR